MIPIDTVRAFLSAIERGVVGEGLAEFFAPDAVHEQKPNAIYPRGMVADVEHLKENSKQGAKLMRAQRYEIVGEPVVQGARVVVEVTWTGTLAVPIKHLKAGDTMTAHCCMLFEHDGDGRIRRQRNYDCYEPF